MRKGFTLIELLVVIVIIGIIAAMTAVALGSVRAKARDTKRIADIRNLQSALEIYKNDNNVYPAYATSGTALVGTNGQTYMAKIPTAPTNTGTDVYTYTGTANGTTYSIAYNLEKGVLDISPGSSTALPGQISSPPPPPPPPPAIGTSYLGGKLAYILISTDPGYDANVYHGLIAATADQSASIAWITGGSTQTTANGNTLTTLGKGQDNTNFMKTQTGYTGGAAKICDDYTITVAGVAYDDWYLPSKDEIRKLNLNKIVIGGFTDYAYWSSSEGSANSVWAQQFNSGNAQSNDDGKSWLYHVRAVRSF